LDKGHSRALEVPIPSFQQQVDRLVTLDYPRLAGISEPDFRDRLEPLRTAAEQITGDATTSTVPFVIVVTRDLVSPYDTVPLLHLAGSDRRGVVDRNHGEGDLASYHPIKGCEPPAAAYLLRDVERGEEFCNVRPEDATRTIHDRGRTPLTIDEGIALVTQQPTVLEKNRCFMLAGSRRTAVPGDRRVPALWISGRAPKLGWCWDGNPHTWLGTASAGSRVS
jgi:uncharacterized protein DUF5701